MPQYTSGMNLGFLVNRCLAVKPNASQSEVVNALNARVRQAINSRIYWSDLLVRRVVSFPNQYTAGTLAFVPGSTLATGTGTGFPVSDAVNTTAAGANNSVSDFGYQEITPASMQGIAIDSLLYCDAGGTPETVAVVETTPISFIANFQYPHSANFTITASSLAGLQLNAGTNFPIFSVRAARSATVLELDQPWGGAAVSGVQYQVIRMYVTFDPLLKVIHSVVDPQQDTTLDLYIPLEQLDAIDPQRSDQQNPRWVVQHSPTEAGTMRYEIYPTVTQNYQLLSLVSLQWPDMKRENDRAPWFIDPNLFVTGACADLLRIKNVRSTLDQDPYFNPQLAMQYEQMFRLQLQECVNADESKAQRAFSSQSSGMLSSLRGNYFVNHDLDNLLRDF